MRNRAIAPVVGVTLLLGLAAIGSMGVLLVGSSLLEDTQGTTEQEQVETSLSELGESADRISSGQVDVAEFAIRGSETGVTRVDEDAGHLELWVETGAGTRDVVNGSMGTLEYRTVGGDRVAFQGGGVWRAGPSGDARLVRPPAFQYRSTDESTLTFEHVSLGGNATGTGPTEGAIRVNETATKYPTPSDPNPLTEGRLHMTVASEYCAGWEQFLDARTDSAVTERCDESGPDTDVGEVKITFAVPFDYPGMDDKEVVVGSMTDSGSRFPSQWYEERDPLGMPSADGVIEAKIEVAEENVTDHQVAPGEYEITDEGLYYAENGSGEYTIDTTDGDVEVAVDGSLNASQIDITGSNNVTMFVREDVGRDFESNTEWNNAGQPEQFRVLVHSDGQFGLDDDSYTGGGNVGMKSFLYAPGSTVYFHTNVNHEGGLVADEVVTHTSSGNHNPDSDVTDIELDFDVGGDPFYYLHVSETNMTVETE